jgi:general secretion pathway protein H
MRTSDRGSELTESSPARPDTLWPPRPVARKPANSGLPVPESSSRSASSGFTLLELLVVISIIAIASAGVSFAIRDSAQTALEREGERLAALLEAGRALSRTTGQALRWRDTPQGFSFDGLNAGNLPKTWLSPNVTVQWPAGPAAHLLLLGPEPIIEPQAIILIQQGRSLRVGTDGLHAFAVLPSS